MAGAWVIGVFIGINLDVDDAMAGAISDQPVPPIGLKHVIDEPPERIVFGQTPALRGGQEIPPATFD